METKLQLRQSNFRTIFSLHLHFYLCPPDGTDATAGFSGNALHIDPCLFSGDSLMWMNFKDLTGCTPPGDRGDGRQVLQGVVLRLQFPVLLLLFEDIGRVFLKPDAGWIITAGNLFNLQHLCKLAQPPGETVLLINIAPFDP
ncbi:MAG TPA: hypothetical protein DIT97_01810 [Gimesia maris]|uniref:Uncharacterized protein n=1 Tax=Gimesia maris TaxID=122 RepID=A0A3D3QZ48_9PLAN|nr:hypothetical protein [Gimesia maris]|tara:strand:- start:854 stop:1279 length:426 start_codon:yes stop_codon:yes gene_type:complete